MINNKVRYRRIILKLSGESLMGKDSHWINKETITNVVMQIKDLLDLGIEVGIVIGGGNIFRGRDSNLGFNKAVSDYIGMLGTIMNALVLQESFNLIGVDTKIQSSLFVSRITEEYIRQNAIEYLKKGKVVIFASGTGDPFFTTDTAAVLRGLEMGCDIILKATNVEGVYDTDPKENINAKKFTKISFNEAISRQLKVMDTTAFALCKEQKLNVIVFGIYKQGALKRIILGEQEGTLVFFE